MLKSKSFTQTTSNSNLNAVINNNIVSSVISMAIFYSIDLAYPLVAALLYCTLNIVSKLLVKAKSPTISGYLSIGSMLIFTFVSSIFTGGISSPFIVFIVPVPLLTAVAFGKKPAIISCIFSLLTILLLAFISLGHFGYSTLENNSYIMNILEFIVSFLVLIQLTSIGISIYNNIKEAGDQIEEDAQNRKELLDSLENGIFFIEKDGVIPKEHSKAMQSMFPDFPEYKDIKKFFFKYNKVSENDSKIVLDLLWGEEPGFSDFSMNVAMLPKAIVIDEDGETRHISLKYKPLYNSQKKLDRILARAKDISNEILQEQKLHNQIERNERISKAVADIEGFKEFLEESCALFDKVDKFPKSDFSLAEPKRYLHTLKGNVALFEFKKLASMIHSLEDLIDQGENQKISELWSAILGLWEEQKNDLVKSLNLNRLENVFPVVRTKLNTLYTWANNENNTVLGSKVWDLYCMPLDDLFNKYKDYCKQLNLKDPSKKVDIVVHKDSHDLAHTELMQFDQAIIHIIKNSIDHGIETTEERTSAGKVEAGTITILGTREQNGKTISLIISDDGKGIDVNKLGNKAVTSGFWTQNKFEQASQQEKLNLIYESGLSTAEELSELSGRGVGMDAVKSFLEAEGGHIQVTTEPGKGTKFEMSLPIVKLRKVA